MVRLPTVRERITKWLSDTVRYCSVCRPGGFSPWTIDIRDFELQSVNMALIELNLEKPALKRTETVENERSSGATLTEQTDDLDEIDEKVTETDIETSETESESKSGGRRVGRKVAMLGAMASALMLARKVRSRRKGTKTESVEEDWQAPESN